MYLSYVRIHLSKYSKNKKAPLAPIPRPPTPTPETQPPASPPQQRLDPTPAPPPPETQPHLLPLSSSDLPQRRNPNPGTLPSSETRPGPLHPALGLPTHPQNPLLPPGGGGGGGGSRVRENATKWRRPLEPRRDPALSRAPTHARASARYLSPPLAGWTTNPTAACK